MDKYKQIKLFKTTDSVKVYLAEVVATKKHVVIKEVEAHQTVANEIRLLSSLQHPNVVRLLDWFLVMEHQQQRVALVLEYCEMGDLRLLAPKARPLLPEITIQLLLALKYLHANGVIHRDLKLENVFVSGWQNGILRVKVGDFGVAKLKTCTQLTTETMLGTPIYFSPEQAARKPYDSAVDVWSLGCLIYELATGRAPFGTGIETFGQLLTEIRGGIVDLGVIEDVQVRQLLKMMLQKDPEQRPSIDDLLCHDILQSWISAFVDKINGQGSSVQNGAKGHRLQSSTSETFSLLTTIQQETRNPLIEAHAKQVALAKDLPETQDKSITAHISKSVHERLATILVLPSRIGAILDGADDLAALKRELKESEMEKILASGLIADILYLRKLNKH